MEALNNGHDCSSWIPATNWTIAHGSPSASVALESSDSPIDSENATSTMKTPLILKPTSPDCGPCEIKISFTQKHEVCQVYV
ncbi:hypothetical protein F0562_018718 [Nyssa sinensis]|uniref:Uncharacterized protein n=1 Tax=Nyssa sinensis TaxID=561372 RepID=A0A5J4ZED7_9ASTE|nr:hypothetical protein F0562_018718 [Nyssa sinensis]